MSERRAVVQLGAGPIQKVLVEHIRRAGLVPVLVDRSERPAAATSDSVHVRASIAEPEAIVAALAEVDLPPIAAVLTSTDLGVKSVPVVSHALGLPHSTLEAIEAMDDKERARDLLEAAGVSIPVGVRGRRAGDVALPDPGREFVVKPVDSSGSRGVRRVRGPIEFEAAVSHALEFSDRYLVEECVSGDHLDVNGFVVNGRFELVSIARRFFTPAPDCVPIYGGLDGGCSRATRSKVERAMQGAVDAFGYRHGPVKADAIESGDRLVLLELAARFHGDVLSSHLAQAAGLAPAAMHWLSRLGLCDRPAERPVAAAWFGVFGARAGKISSIEGLDAFRASGAFRSWIPRLAPGDEVGAPSDNRALVGFGILAGESGDAIWRAARDWRERIRVELD